MRKRLALLLGSLAVIMAVLLFIPSIFRTQVAEALREEVNQRINAKVTFTDADINLWRHFPQFTVQLNNFSIAGEKEFLGDTLVHAGTVNLVVSSWQLLFNEGIEIRELSLNEPTFFIKTLENGKANFHIVDEDSTDSAEDVVMKVETWEIQDGKFIYDDDETGVRIGSSGVTLNGNIGITGSVTSFRIAAITEACDVDYEHRNFFKDKQIVINLDGSYDSGKDLLSFTENAVTINNLALTFSGSIQFTGDSQEVDLKFKTAEAGFSDILSLNSSLAKDFKRLKIGGNMSLAGEFLGTYNSERNTIPAFKMNLIVSEGSIKYQTLPSSLNDINFDLAAYNTTGKLENTIIELQYIGMKIGENPLFGSARIGGFNNGTITADLLAKFPLEDLTNIFPMDGLALDGDLSVELKADGPYTGQLSQLFDNLSVPHSKIPSFTLGVDLSNGLVKYSHLPEAIQDVNLKLYAENKTGVFDDTFLKIERIHALMGDNPLTGFATISGVRTPEIKADIKGSVDLAEIRNFYPVDDLTLKGLLKVDMNVDGKLDDSTKQFPKVYAHINLGNGFIQSSQYPAPMENAHLVLQAINETGRFADTQLIIDTLTFAIENEPFFITGAVQDLDKYNYDLNMRGVLYLDKLQKIFAINNVQLGGEVDVDFSTVGNLRDLRENNYHRLPTKGQLNMKDVFVKTDMLLHDLRISEGHMLFTNEKILLDTLHGTLGESNFNLTGHLYNHLAFVFHEDEVVKGDLLFESENFDLNELLRDHTSNKDTVHHDLNMLIIPANIDFTFDSKIKLLTYKNLAVTDIDGEIAIQDGVLSLNKTTFNTMDAAFALSGDYDSRDLRHPKFDADISIHELDINKAHEAFVTIQSMAPAAEHTYGIFSIDYQLKGELLQNMFPVFESLSGGGVVRISDARVNGMKLFHHISGITKKEELMNPQLKDIVMETTVENGIVFVKPFSMKLAGFDTEIEGRHELNGSMNYVLKIALPPFDILKIPLHANGTYDKPKVHLGKGHEDNLKRTIDVVSNPAPMGASDQPEEKAGINN